MNIQFRCPMTHELIDTVEVPGTLESMKENWSTRRKLQCPHCGGEHSVSFREAYLDGAIRPADRDHSPPEDSSRARMISKPGAPQPQPTDPSHDPGRAESSEPR